MSRFFVINLCIKVDSALYSRNEIIIMAIQSDFMLSVNQIAAERGISTQEVIDSICYAIVSNYQDMLGYTDNIDAYYDEKEGMLKVISKKEVVDHAEDEAHEIPLIQAILLNPKAKVGETIEIDVTKDGNFGRVAAQAARSVLYQKVREIERDTIIKSFEDRVGKIETGVVQRVEFNKATKEVEKVIVEIRKALAVMKLEDKIPGEIYKSGNKIKVVLKAIENDGENRRLVVSRADPMFLQGLFELEIPEIESGSVEIKAISREAGSRAKVAVWSNENGIDAIGSCVGQKGIRINSITNELRFGKFEEKVDIILWDPNKEMFVANALSPAQTIKVKYFEEGLKWEELESNGELIIKNEKSDENIESISENPNPTTENSEENSEELNSNSKNEETKINPKSQSYVYEGFTFTKDENSDPVYAIEPNTAKIIVPDEQLSLAIGKEGQNARLAARLTGIKIDIQGETKKVETNQKVDILEN